MNVNVVPVMRLRRATTWWTYSVPASASCAPGSLVAIPFRGASCLGIVWSIETEAPSASIKPLEAVITSNPLLRSPQRAFAERLAEHGLCSLSTVLHAMLPTSLRRFPLTKPARSLLADFDAITLSPAEIAARKQHLVLTPSRRQEAESQLATKYGAKFAILDSQGGDNAELKEWLAVALGTVQVGIGRENALFAPWVNLRHVTVINPEDIAFFREQIPYANQVEAARFLAETTRAECSLRSFLPDAAAKRLWGERAAGSLPRAEVELTDLRKENILGPRLIELIRETVASGKRVLILYNAHDRALTKEDGTRVIMPGIETVEKRLAYALGGTLPASVTVGTRAILPATYQNLGLAVMLSADPLLAQESAGDRIHGWSDIGRLLALSPKVVVQSREPAHSLLVALTTGGFEAWCLRELAEASEAGLPPFSEQIVCSIKAELSEDAEKVYGELLPIIPDAWKISSPYRSMRRKVEMANILIHAPQGTRVPAPLHAALAKLPSPWKVQRNPWYGV